MVCTSIYQNIPDLTYIKIGPKTSVNVVQQNVWQKIRDINFNEWCRSWASCKSIKFRRFVFVCNILQLLKPISPIGNTRRVITLTHRTSLIRFIEVTDRRQGWRHRPL